MKKTEYDCDLCGKHIVPIHRTIPLAYDKTTSCYKSFMRIKISQIRPMDNCTERDTVMDLCDDCYNSINNVILSRLKKETTNEENYDD